MTKTVSAFSRNKNPAEAGKEFAAQIACQIEKPDAIIVFLGGDYDLAPLLGLLKEQFPNTQIVGCSSAGEVGSRHTSKNAASALAIHSTDMLFSAGLVTGIAKGPEQAALRLLTGFRGFHENQYRYRTALVLCGATNGLAEEMITALHLETGGKYRFFGGGAGSGMEEDSTEAKVFMDEEVKSDAAVALEILSTRPIGIGVRHGWTAATNPLRVTSSHGIVVESLNAIATAEIFKRHAMTTGQELNPEAPQAFFVHNAVGMRLDSGYKLRLPVALLDNDAVAFSAEIPNGATLSIMCTTDQSSTNAARIAAQEAINQLSSYKASGALLFDSAATGWRMGEVFHETVEAVQETLGEVPLCGCNVMGQIATLKDQFSGYHNCSAVVCVFPE